MIEGWRTGRTNPVYLEEHEVRAAGGAQAPAHRPRLMARCQSAIRSS